MLDMVTEGEFQQLRLLDQELRKKKRRKMERKIRNEGRKNVQQLRLRRKILCFDIKKTEYNRGTEKKSAMKAGKKNFQFPEKPRSDTM